MLRVILALSLCFSIAACGNSRLNPLTWFGGDREQRIRVIETEAAQAAQDTRPLVSEVIDMNVEATSSGAIVRATGRVPYLGYFAPVLLEVERSETAIVFEFRVEPPENLGQTGPDRALEVVAATTLGRDDLAGLRTITIVAQANRRSVNRR